MAVDRDTVLYDVHDFKVYPLLTDLGETTGASPTYGAAVDVPGIHDASLAPNLITAELKGDARVISKKGRTDRFKVSAKYGKLALNVLSVIMGGVITDTSATEVRYDLVGPAPLPYFKTEFKIDDTDGDIATAHCIVYKCQITGGTLITQSTDNYGQPTFDLEGIQPGDGITPMSRIRFLTNPTALSA